MAYLIFCGSSIVVPSVVLWFLYSSSFIRQPSIGQLTLVLLISDSASLSLSLSVMSQHRTFYPVWDVLSKILS